MSEILKHERGGLKYILLKYAGTVLLKIFDLMVRLVSPNEVFFETIKFDFVKCLEQNWKIIKQECVEVLLNENIPNIQDVFQEQDKITEGENWKSYIFMIFGYQLEEHCKRCPETIKLIQSIPGISSAMFSVLAPGKQLIPHKGIYKGVLRYHLSLIVPENESLCRLVVNGETRSWTEGESLIFDDTFVHAAYNDSSETRVVLFIDIIRKLPFPINYINKGIFVTLKKSPFIQNIIVKSKRLEKLTIKELKVDFK